MKFINAVHVLTLASVAPRNNNIDAHTLHRHSKSTAAMLLVGQSKLFHTLVTAVDVSFGRSSMPRLKKNPLTLRSSKVINGMECSFGVDSSAKTEEQLDNEQIDLGVLGVCDNAEYICAEDKWSSIGGRCVLRTEVVHDVTWPNTEVEEVERKLDPCPKCSGYAACLYTDRDKIGCNSCNGHGACYNMGGTVAANSCNGIYACMFGEKLRSVGKSSCNGRQACYSSDGAVADYSCSDYKACMYLNGASIGSHSCNGPFNCYESTCPVIGNYECNAQAVYGVCTYSDCPQPETVSPTRSPSVLPSHRPTMSPSKSPSSRPFLTPSTSPPSNTPTMSPTTNCFPRASKVKLQSITSTVLQVFEVKVYSSGNDVAAGKAATQSSLHNDKITFAASKAVDGKENTFSHTAISDKASWWEVDLGGMFPIESVKILNRWCQNPSDPSHCLCRLSHAAVVFFDNQSQWVYSNFIGDTCNVTMYENIITGSTEYCTAS